MYSEFCFTLSTDCDISAKGKLSYCYCADAAQETTGSVQKGSLRLTARLFATAYPVARLLEANVGVSNWGQTALTAGEKA
jgi:hypothetical protein